MPPRTWLAAIFLGAVAVAAFYVIRTRPREAAQNIEGEKRYVEPALCAACHPNVWETYQRTGMARSFGAPALANTTGEAGRSVTYYHKASESYFTMIERGGRFYQRRHQTGFDGKETNVLEKEIHFVLGSGNHARAYLHRTSRGTLVELPLAWYAENGGYWAMNPAYDRPDHPGFRRKITNGCMFCHNGIREAPPAGEKPLPEPAFPGRLAEGIDCQRCHGPGSRHVGLAQTAGAKREDIRGAIVNPARLSPERQIEVCLQCHLETTSFPLPNAIVRYERGPFSYQPGEPLADFALHFDRAGGHDLFEIAGAGYRLRRSECFVKSEGALRCTSCHNPHDIPRGEQAAQHYTQACRQCHAGGFDQLVAARKHPASNDCIGCHMPKRRTDDVVHVVMTDHYIQRRKPAGNLLAPVAERHITDENGYRGEVVPYYPSQAPKESQAELYVAVAQVSQKSNVTGGIQRLTEALEKHRPARIEFALHLGDALRDGSQAAKAVEVYEEAVRRMPDSLVALQKLASGLTAAGQFARAVEVLRRASQLAPDDAVTWHQLGQSYLDVGSRKEAVAAFETAVRLDPDLPEAHNSLGGVLLESGETGRAETVLREALRLQPDYAEARSNLASALASTGRLEEAVYHFEAAIRLKPGYTAARFNYGLALARAKRLAEAQRQIEGLLKADPAAAEARDLLGNLLAAQGRTQAALAQYREAIRIRPDFGRAHLDLGAMLAELGDVSGAVPHLQKAAASPEPAVREEAVQMLRQLTPRR
jgi:predicted CXXCH cytochrome family protein